MRRLDLRALGWVVTRDACSEIARKALGRRPKMPTAAFRELGDRWRAIQAPCVADQAEPFGAFLVAQPRTFQSEQRDNVVIEFVDCLQAFRPDLV